MTFFLYQLFLHYYTSCLIDFDELNLKISSSIFENNQASYGGAFYLSNSITNYNENNNKYAIEIMDSQFIDNKAEYYGGAIFFNFNGLDLSNMKNSSFIRNHAYAGGALYIDDTNYKLIEENDENQNNKFINNTFDSHGEVYATGPYLISLDNIKVNEITVGNMLNLKFNLTDKFNQIVHDISKYYPNIILNTKFTINADNSNFDNEDVNDIVKLTGNSCTFTKGN